MSGGQTFDELNVLKRITARGAIITGGGGSQYGVGGSLNLRVTGVGSPAGSPVTLRTLPVAFTRDRVDGLIWVRATASGSCANNANAKNVSFVVGGTTVLSLDLTPSTGNSWWMQVLCGVRTPWSTLAVSGFGAQGPGTPTFALHSVSQVAGLDLAADVAFATVVTQTDAGDVTQDFYLIEGAVGTS